jgi:hypothetical protein
MEWRIWSPRWSGPEVGGMASGEQKENEEHLFPVEY